jgi:hypothetical protein
MIAIVELHATTSGHGLRKPQFNSNANLQSERPVFRLTHRSKNIATSSQHPSGRYIRLDGNELRIGTCCEDPAARQQDEPTDKANVGRRMALKSRSQPKSGAPGFALTSHYVRRRLHPARLMPGVAAAAGSRVSLIVIP